MMPRHSTVLAGVLLALVSASPAAAQHQGPPASATLVRCQEGSAVPCVEVRVPLDTVGVNLLARFDSSGEAGAWAGWIGATRLVGPGVAVPQAVSPPLRLLVLLDLSGSMRGPGIAYTRVTLKSFIQSLDSSSIRVAVAGFESRDVARGIESVPFQTPSNAAAALAALPPPDAAGNTALYAALEFGVERVSQAVSAEPGVRGAVLLVTDGRNDVGHSRDDPGLAAGDGGLAAARGAAERSGQRIWLLGVGPTPAAEELRALAGASGSVMIASLNPNAMARTLDRISRELHAARVLTFGVPGRASLSLGRSAWVGAVAVEENDRPLALHALQWQPPLFALPTFEGVADSLTVPPALSPALAAGSTGSLQWLMALLFGMIGAACWVLVPRMLWRQHVAVVAPGEPVASKADRITVEAAAATEGGLLGGVTEAPPRKPDAITAEYPVQPTLAGRR